MRSHARINIYDFSLLLFQCFLFKLDKIRTCSIYFLCLYWIKSKILTIPCRLFVEASRGAGGKCVIVNGMSNRLWVHFLHGVEAKRDVATLHGMPSESDGKCFNTRLSLPTLTHAEYREKLIFCFSLSNIGNNPKQKKARQELYGWLLN